MQFFLIYCECKYHALSESKPYKYIYIYIFALSYRYMHYSGSHDTNCSVKLTYNEFLNYETCFYFEGKLSY